MAQVQPQPSGAAEPRLAPPLSVSSAAEGPPLAPAAARDDEQPPDRKPDVIYVPTPQPVVDRMLQVANVKPNDVVYDLGCGDGRIVVTAAKRHGARAVGFDIDPERVAEARENVRQNGVEHLVRIEHKDIFTVDLTPANVVTLYLLPELNVKLVPQLERMKAGSRIVSHDFDIAGVEPQQQLTLRANGMPHQIYLFQTPLQKSE